jgi:hypothetical protein
MPKFTFISEHNTGEKITFEFNKEYLPDILQEFEMFLRGAGFHFSGNLDFVEDAYEGQGFAQFDPNAKEFYHHV